MIRVLVVDDSSFVRRAVRRMLMQAPDLEVVGEARDGRTALLEIARLSPDVVTLDLKMPGLDGLAMLEHLMEEHPTPVVLLSSHAQEDAMLTVRALAVGAVDFIDKSRVSPMEVYDLAPELIGKLRAAAGSRPRAWLQGQPTDVVWHAMPSPIAPRIVVLGASTGGPSAVETIVSALPARLGAPVLVVQHMPAGFTAAFARRLEAASGLPVREGRLEDELVPDTILVAPGGHEVVVVEQAGSLYHRAVVARGRAWPRLDVVLLSAVAAAGAGTCAAVLTGMGNDGCLGARNVREAGGTVIAQSAASCAVYGMSRAVIEAGYSTCVAPLGAIAGVIASLAPAVRGAA